MNSAYLLVADERDRPERREMANVLGHLRHLLHELAARHEYKGAWLSRLAHVARCFFRAQLLDNRQKVRQRLAAPCRAWSVNV